MAQNAPNCKDTQEIQFKLLHKFVTFKNCGEPRSNVKLLAISSSRGLLFAGNPKAPELKVIIIKDVATSKSNGKQPLARQIQLPSIPNYMACSADGNLLAINYMQQTGTSFLLIYSVQSFMTPEVRVLYNIRLSPDDFVHAVQLLWNPVLPNSLAVILSNGGLCLYVLKDAGNFELNSLDKSQQVKCGCWSPKGKQLVLGFSGGRLQQFKPDLTPAKTLACPPNIHNAPFDTIAVHWLSTYQFAVIFLQHGQNCHPSLYIINAPKVGAPAYINYYDICFSLDGPRTHQFDFTHVSQWNLLLVTSANGVEVGVLGTSEAGDTPTWQQFALLDEARIEMPLREGTQDETFPIGFVYDTSTVHQLTINEKQLISMPMVHVLSTDGTLLAFDFLNLQPSAVSVCSPPPPLADTSGQFIAMNALLGPTEQPKITSAPVAAPAAPVEPTTPSLADISFAITPNTVTSTPAPPKDKPASIFAGFGNTPNKAPTMFAAPSAPLNFGAPPKPMPAVNFSGFGAPAASGTAFGLSAGTTFTNPVQDKPAPVISAPVAQLQPTIAVTATKANTTPLYTVPPTFAPVASAAAPTSAATSQPVTSVAAKNSEFTPGEVDDVIAEIMSVQISTFSELIEQQKQQNKVLLSKIEAPSTIGFYSKRLDDLQELNELASDVEFELDVQELRHALSESYAMIAECRAKLDVYKNPNVTRLMSSTSFDAAGRRMLSRLQSYSAANEAQLQLAQQQIDAQWEQHQDVLRRSCKSKMNMPCLEVIYQRLTRLQNRVSEQRVVQNNIKTKLKDRGLLQSALFNQETSRSRNNEAVDTLADSILSMSLNQEVDANRAKLSQQKLKSIRTLLAHHKTSIISPQRPDRVGLKSEVILETKMKSDLKKKTAASLKPAMTNKATQASAAAAPVATQLPKPTASKPTVAAAAVSNATAATITTPTIAPVTAPTSVPFSFSQSSPFAKTAAATTTITTLSTGEVPKPAPSIFSGTTPFSFGQLGAAKPGLPVGSLNPPNPTVPAASPPNPFGGFGSSAIDATKPKLIAEQPKEAPAVKPLEPKPEVPTSEPAVTVSIKSIAATQPVNPVKVEPAVKSLPFAPFGGNAGTAGGANSIFSFGGFGSSLGSTPTPSFDTAFLSATTAAVTTVATVASPVKPVVSSPSNRSTSGSTLNLGTATTIVASTTVSEPSSTSNTAIGTSIGTASTTTQPIDNLFGSFNICKPTTKEPAADASTTSVFSFALPGSGDDAKSLFGGNVSGIAESTMSSVSDINNTTTMTVIKAPAIVGATSATTAAAPATITAIPATITAATSIAPPATLPATAAIPLTTATLSTMPSTPASTTSISGTTITPIVAPTTSAPSTTLATTTVASATPGSSFSFSNAFSNLGTASATPAVSSLVAGTVATPPNVSSGTAFGGGNTFGSATVTSSPFQAATAAAAAPTGNIFGGMPKPEASVFGGAAAPAPPTGLFAGAAASTNTPPFGGTTVAAPVATASSSGNIFGQAVATTPAAGSIFGGSTAATPFAGGSIFSGSNNTAQSSPAAPAPAASVFGQSVFASSGNSLFGSTAAAQPQASAFGGGGSIFAAAAANTATTPVSGGSLFGGGSSGGFGSFAQTTPAPGGFGGSFAQSSGTSVAQSGFGSPQQQTAQSPGSGFGAKPVFGSPAFGGGPTFGGAPTFGSPKTFGGFGANTAAAPPPAFGGAAKAAEGNIFDTLGGTDTGLSFGNLAQTGNTNAQKPAFGGSSFMTYR